MKNLFSFKSIRSKMILGFSLVMVLTVLLGSYNLLSIHNVNKSTEEIVNRQLPYLISNEQLAISMANRIAASRGYVLSGHSNFKDQFQEYTEQGIASEKAVREIGVNEEFTDLIESTVEWREYVDEMVFKEYDKGNEKIAQQNLLKSNTDAQAIMNGYEKMAGDKEVYILDLEQGILANGKATFNIVIIVTSLVIILSLLVAMLTSNSISRPLIMVMQRMQLIAGGDLSGTSLQTNAQDEIGQLVVATNEMNDTTRGLLNQINSVSETVNSQSEELTQSANEVRAGSEQVAMTLEGLASGAESQANSASDLSSVMGTFTTRLEETNENGEHIQIASNNVLTMTNEGAKLMESSTKQMAMIDQIVNDAVDKVEGLDTHSQEISELVSVIQGIADQTNLLALNAAIEAARAGEHGQGFAVVADEVRKLAEESSLSVTDITSIVSNIQSEASTVAGSLREGYKEVEQGTNEIRLTGETFKQISAAVTEMASRIMIVSSNLSEITSSSEEMGQSIEEIAAISEESAAGVEETSATSQQANSAMEEVASSSGDLALLAEELNGLVLRFKL